MQKQRSFKSSAWADSPNSSLFDTATEARFLDRSEDLRLRILVEIGRVVLLASVQHSQAIERLGKAQIAIAKCRVIYGQAGVAYHLPIETETEYTLERWAIRSTARFVSRS